VGVDKAKTEKLHVLAVLENGALRNVYEIGFMLEKSFDLKPKLNTLRKNLQRCSEQRLVIREKIGRNYSYRIAGKGKERLRIIRAKRKEKFEKRSEDFAKSGELQRFLYEKKRIEKKWIRDRMLEVNSSLMLCNALLSLSRDEVTLDFAKAIKMYWQIKHLELIPYVSGEMVNTMKHLSEQIVKTIEKLFT